MPARCPVIFLDLIRRLVLLIDREEKSVLQVEIVQDVRAEIVRFGNDDVVEIDAFFRAGALQNFPRQQHPRRLAADLPIADSPSANFTQIGRGEIFLRDAYEIELIAHDGLENDDDHLFEVMLRLMLLLRRQHFVLLRLRQHHIQWRKFRIEGEKDFLIGFRSETTAWTMFWNNSCGRL